MWKSESVSVSRDPDRIELLHRSFLLLHFYSRRSPLSCKDYYCRRVGNPRPREKGTSAGQDKRLKAKGRQQVLYKKGLGSGKHNTQFKQCT
jgi:hypothetical protein